MRVYAENEVGIGEDAAETPQSITLASAVEPEQVNMATEEQEVIVQLPVSDDTQEKPAIGDDTQQQFAEQQVCGTYMYI